MTAQVLLSKATKALKKNSPEILTAIGVSGVITTAYLTAKATLAAERKLESEAPVTSAKDRAQRTWKLYIPPAISGAVTIGCIICANRGGSRRAAAAATAYSLTERAFNEYKEKVIEQFGENKEQKLRDDLAQDQVNRNPPPSESSNQVVVVGPGQVLCREAHTGRYFKSDMETLRRVTNEINAKAIQELYVCLSEFYYRVGLEMTSQSDYFGWSFEKVMELRYSSCLTPSGEPCLSFEYNYVKQL